MTKDFFIKQLDGVIEDFNKLKSNAKYDDLSDRSEEEVMQAISKAKAAVVRITSTLSEYYKDIDSTLKRTNIYEGEKLRHIIGTIHALRSDLQNDYLKSLSEIIQCEVFSDYLEMADHLLTEGYKDPSAVLIGSTLEAHLKELCKTNKIDLEFKNGKGELVPKKTNVLNSDLTKASIYSSVYQKQVTAWLGIRNSAAHGQYADYQVNEVKLMLMGVRQFILTTK
jgi:hypothetical protein